jgi:hypothetical protein
MIKSLRLEGCALCTIAVLACFVSACTTEPTDFDDRFRTWKR